MNLRNRSLLVLGLTFFVFFIIIAAVSLTVTLSGLDRIEHQRMADSINQTRSALGQESASLLSTARDWGWWDDTYQFVGDRNTGFIDRNANPSALATIRVNLFMILDANNTLVHGLVLPPGFETDSPVSVGMETRVRNTPSLVSPAAGEDGVSGILATPDGPMIIAAVPVMQSDRAGPARGTLVMGRLLEPDPLRRISEMTDYDIAADWPGKAGAGTAAPDIRNRLDYEGALVVVPVNETHITGYSAMKDLSGQEIILIVTMGRDLYRTGYANIVTYLALLALWAIMTGLIMVIVMDRTVLRRTGILADHVRSLSGRPESVPHPVLAGNDELAELEKTIISSRRDLLMREEQLRVFINAMPGPAGLFSRDGTILLANPVFSRVLKGPGEDVTGTLIQSYFPPAELEKFERFVQEAIRTREVVQFEYDAGDRTFLMSFYPIPDNNRDIIQLGFLAFDISERKRLENALQRLTKKIALLNTVIFSDIQNKVFVQTGYIELLKSRATDPQLKSYVEKEEAIIFDIQELLQFARQYNEMGMSPPRWQNVMEVMLFAISHLDLGTVRREFTLEGLFIYADSLLERVFVALIENAIIHAKGATVIRAGYIIEGDEAVIFIGDDGPGIPEDRKDTIFEKGFGSGGSGSLFLSREILSVTGMTISETGVPGKGARFEIRVPKGSWRFTAK